MAPQSITYQQLSAAGFSRMPDVWLYCPRRRRHEYFERWFHSEWNVSFVPGYGAPDSQYVTEEELILLIQAQEESARIMQEQNRAFCL